MKVYAVMSPYGDVVKLFSSHEKACLFIDENESAWIRNEHTVEEWEVE